MEERIAILIADLSGYTALTETHGAVSAADMIDKYVEIVENCLVGDCKLQERRGDEVLIISSSTDHLLSTAVMLMQNICKEENFLHVHGGLHYGTVLKRKDSYFGSTINLTARIAAKANAGTFWCSDEFIAALTDTSEYEFQSKGKHSFKNVNEEKELTEVVNVHAGSLVVDPVCRMLILEKNNAIQHPENNDLFFCSHECLKMYTSRQADRSAIDNH